MLLYHLLDGVDDFRILLLRSTLVNELDKFGSNGQHYLVVNITHSFLVVSTLKLIRIVGAQRGEIKKIDIFINELTKLITSPLNSM